MKKSILFLMSFLCISTILLAQVKTYTKSARTTNQKIVGEIPPAPAPAPAPAPINKSTSPGTDPAPVASIYSLTSVRVNLKTGADNKEFPSQVFFSLYHKNYDLTKGDSWENFGLFEVKALKNEMKVNSNTEMGLGKIENGDPNKSLLSNIQNHGLIFEIVYDPNFFMDAWRIEGVTVTLEFKDQNGNYHPNMGTRTITFNNAVGFLNAEYRRMICTIDGSMNGITASIEKCPDCTLFWKNR